MPDENSFCELRISAEVCRFGADEMSGQFSVDGFKPHVMLYNASREQMMQSADEWQWTRTRNTSPLEVVVVVRGDIPLAKWLYRTFYALNAPVP